MGAGLWALPPSLLPWGWELCGAVGGACIPHPPSSRAVCSACLLSFCLLHMPGTRMCHTPSAQERQSTQALGLRGSNPGAVRACPGHWKPWKRLSAMAQA